MDSQCLAPHNDQDLPLAPAIHCLGLADTAPLAQGLACSQTRYLSVMQAAATGPQGDVVPQDPRQRARAAQQQQQQAGPPAGSGPLQNQAAAARAASEGAGGQAPGAQASGRGGAGGDTRPVDPRKKQRVPAELQAAGLSLPGLSVEDEEMPDAEAEGRPTLKRKPVGGPGGEGPPAVKPRLSKGQSCVHAACSLARAG